jgi:regulator of protease activity HflC (stomatin/prohibitin superfamily)
MNERILARLLLAGGALIALIVVLSMIGNLFEDVDANEIMVLQAVPSGHLSVYKTPGWKWQGFGRVTKYHKRVQFNFLEVDKKREINSGLRVRFNDGGHAFAYGSFAWEMPIADSMVIPLHMKYGSEEGIANQLIRPSAERCVYMTGPLMSSTESYAVRRPDLLSYIEDQLQRGVYRTRKIDMKAPDPITGQEKTISVVELVADERGTILRQERSPLSEFGIRTFNLSLREITYDESVEKQIRQQQEMAMAVQTAIAEAKQAEQRRITTEQSGMADAAKAKWDQEVIKAKEVTAAQQRLAVADLDAQAAAKNKIKMTLDGEGEGAKRRAIIAGDNALDKRLDAWLKAQEFYADAIKNYQGNWVPTVVSGGGSGTATRGNELLEYMGIKAARDLALDMGMGTSKR